MFKPHKTGCSSCSQYGYVVVKALLCHRCNEELKREKKGLSKVRAPIKKVSDKRKALDIAYSILRADYLKQHPHCQIAIRGVCTYESIDIHHTHWGQDREKYMNDFSTVLSTCRNCHSYVHNVMSAKEARELGLKK